jgi:hypothetical protein
MLVTLILAGLALASPAAQPPQLVLGPQRTLVPAAERHAADLTFWPDGPLGVEREGSRYVFEGPSHGDIARTAGTLDDPVSGGVTPAIEVKGAAQALPDVGYAAGGPIYRDPSSGMRLMFVHLERYPTGDPRGGSYASIGLASSTDDGHSWRFLGPIFTQNLTYEQFKADPGRCGSDQENRQYGVVNTSFGQYVIRNEGGTDYFYIYGADAQQPPADGGACPVSFAVARAPVSEVVDAARQGGVSDWRKYFDGSWDEAGLGGRSSDVWPRTRLLSFDVSWNTYLHRYVLVMPDLVSGNRFELQISESADGVHWSTPATAFETRGEIYAPTIVGLGNDTRTSGQAFYVLYTNSPRQWSIQSRWIDGRLRSRVVAFR